MPCAFPPPEVSLALTTMITNMAVSPPNKAPTKMIFAHSPIHEVAEVVFEFGSDVFSAATLITRCGIFWLLVCRMYASRLFSLDVGKSFLCSSPCFFSIILGLVRWTFDETNVRVSFYIYTLLSIFERNSLHSSVSELVLCITIKRSGSY